MLCVRCATVLVSSWHLKMAVWVCSTYKEECWNFPHRLVCSFVCSCASHSFLCSWYLCAFWAGHAETIFDCRFRPSLPYVLATSSYDGTVKVGRLQLCYCLYISYCLSYCWLFCPSLFLYVMLGVLLCDDVQIWDACRSRCEMDLVGQDGVLYGLAWSPGQCFWSLVDSVLSFAFCVFSLFCAPSLSLWLVSLSFLPFLYSSIWSLITYSFFSCYFSCVS